MLMWAPLIEKALAKVKGSYSIANGGLVTNSLRLLTGAPAFSFDTADLTDDAKLLEGFNQFKQADEKKWVAGAGTAGSGNDQELNACGIAMSHAYSVLHAFTIGNENMLMIRNPWGTADYTGPWRESDAKWTPEAKALVPLGIDPTTSCKSDGIFFVPMASFKQCFEAYAIAHTRDSEGYTNDWYDYLGADEEYHTFFFKTPEQGTDLYVSVETYLEGVIPTSCVSNEAKTEQVPVLRVKVLRAKDEDKLWKYNEDDPQFLMY
jgi:hypothetical protein